MTFKKAIVIFLLAVLSAVLIFVVLNRQHIATVPGFVALYSCGDVFVTGRTDDSAVAADAMAAHPIFSYTNLTIDREHQLTTASLPLGLFERVAVYRSPQGCSLVTESSIAALRAQGSEKSRPDVVIDGLPMAAPRPGLEAILDSAFEEETPGGQKNTRAIVVMHRGEVVAERYAVGFDVTTPLLGWSMSKSILDAIAGLLVKDGRLQLMQNHLLPQWEGDERADITVEQLMDMSSGLDFDENYVPGGDAVLMLFNSGDASRFAAQSKLGKPPGTFWEYSSGTSNLLAHVLRKALGAGPVSFARYINERLFEPLGIHSVVMESDESGDLIASSFTYATARDWLRFGMLYMQNGRWQGEEILPAEWVARLKQPLAHDAMGHYRSQFWLNAGLSEQGERLFPRLPRDLFMAWGHDQQQLIMIPSRDLIVARFGRTLDDSWDTQTFVEKVMAQLRR